MVGVKEKTGNGHWRSEEAIAGNAIALQALREIIVYPSVYAREAQMIGLKVFSLSTFYTWLRFFMHHYWFVSSVAERIVAIWTSWVWKGISTCLYSCWLLGCCGSVVNNNIDQRFLHLISD